MGVPASLLLLALLGCRGRGEGGSAGDTGAADDACDEPVEGAVALPEDDAPHDEAVEWWYWTGHLDADDGRRFGFELVFFRFAYGPSPILSAHAALTDVGAGTFAFDMPYAEGDYPAAEDGFELEVGENRAAGGDGRDHLEGVPADGVSFSLDLESLKRPVLQHGDGYHEYEQGGFTWYYSRERMAVSGTVRLADGAEVAVDGLAWFDHQWGALTAIASAGWRWFALQLDDGREIMLFAVQDGDGLVGGSLTDDACRTRELVEDEVSIEATGEWTSPHTGCTWPAGWNLRVADLDLHVEPVVADQELSGPYATYWEGAADVTGDATGRAYVELVGYCSG